MTKKIKSIKLTVKNCIQCPYCYIQYGDEYGEPISADAKCNLCNGEIIYHSKLAVAIPTEISIPEWCQLEDA